MNPGMPRSHQPKGSMCLLCRKAHHDCSDLPFESMPVIGAVTGGVKLVRCTQYVRDGAGKAAE